MDSFEYFFVTYRRLIAIVLVGALLVLGATLWAAHRRPTVSTIVVPTTTVPPGTPTTLPTGVTTTVPPSGPLAPGEIDPAFDAGKTLRVDIGHQLTVAPTAPTGIALTSSEPKIVLAGQQNNGGLRWVLVGLHPGVATIVATWPVGHRVVFRVRSVAVAPPTTTPPLSHRSVAPFTQAGQTVNVPVNTDVTLTGLSSDLHAIAVTFSPTRGILYTNVRDARGNLVPVVQVFSPGLYQVTVRENGRQATVMLKASR